MKVRSKTEVASAVPHPRGQHHQTPRRFRGQQQCHHLDALSDAVKKSVETAKAADRKVVTFADVQTAVTGVIAETALAKKAIFIERKRNPAREKGTPPARVADVLNASCNGVSAHLQCMNLAEKSARTIEPVSNRLTADQLAEV